MKSHNLAIFEGGGWTHKRTFQKYSKVMLCTLQKRQDIKEFDWQVVINTQVTLNEPALSEKNRKDYSNS